MAAKGSPILGGVGGYGVGKVTEHSYEEAIERVKASLQEEQFGVLTEIDMTTTLKERAGKDIGRRYVILGACNPNLAYQAVSAEPEIGLLLPCNVVVAETDEGSYVGAVDVREMMRVVDNDALQHVMEEVHARLSRAVERV